MTVQALSSLLQFLLSFYFCAVSVFYIVFCYDIYAVLVITFSL